MNTPRQSHVTWQYVAIASLVVLSSVVAWQFDHALAAQRQSSQAMQHMALQITQLTEQVREQNQMLATVPDTRRRVTILEGKVGRLQDDVKTLQARGGS